jgi:hypothetical protein
MPAFPPLSGDKQTSGKQAKNDASDPSLPNRNVRFDGEFRRESGLVLLMSFVDFEPSRTLLSRINWKLAR